MAKEDYYRTLGVDREAGKDDLKKAYRKQAMRYHPDRNPGDKDAEHRFKEISEAYEVLKDDQKRAAYDRFGHAAFEHGGAGGAGFGAGPGFGTGFADIFEEMFGDFMGGGRQGGRSSGRGADLRYNMQVTLEEAFKGRKTTIRVPTAVACEVCAGTGSAKGSGPAPCSTCRGAGRVRSQSGFFTVERTCPTCGGTGQVIKDPCGTCGGSGRAQKEKTLQVTIPPGVEDGTRIRLAGEGEAGMRGGPPGDLYIFVGVAPHRIFQRDGANIYCRMPLPMTTAALGGQVEVPTLDGSRARITLPAGTQTGEQFRLRGKGMTVLRSQSRGDMFVEAVVETPVNLTDEQKKLLRDFEGAGNHEQHSPESHGFFAKVKELWEDLKE
jgi:molecular chaperone DnaJ